MEFGGEQLSVYSKLTKLEVFLTYLGPPGFILTTLRENISSGKQEFHFFYFFLLKPNVELNARVEYRDIYVYIEIYQRFLTINGECVE